MKAKEIDKKSFVPIYYQLQELLVGLIESGELNPGDKLPSENELVTLYKISRNTAQKALRALVDWGLAQRIQGKGTFVCNKSVTFSITASLSMTSEIIGLNKEPYSKMLQAKIIGATLDIARKLGIEKDDPVYILQRLRFVDKMPVMIQTSYIPVKFLPGLLNKNLEDASLFGIFMRDYNIGINNASEVMRAVSATQFEGEMLGIAEHSPAFLLQRLTYLKSGEVFEYAKTIVRGDKSKFFVELNHRELK
ncbi:MAG: GntR family transcriptional regulator [Candidatus Neomarinimicrobiota bacterium]|jgi:GntR family transcriptional regulator|nr:GntR family transcriptional regulator [Candidatus Neomarinimicrobiota bacterium]MDD3966044.1 GntR family transcriptional regulator [Candidatus Neomarinimicrobiota bacterium]MDX9780472.1 GntR family transcriptional regulator [bacterium]